MSRAATIAIGIIITLAAAGLIAFLFEYAAELYPKLILVSVILFQLSFIWTCAEIIDTPDEILPRNDPPDDQLQY